MINLLPTEQIELVNLEYRRRRLLVAGAFFLAWLGIIILLASSFYLLMRSERLAAESQLASGEAALGRVATKGAEVAELAQVASDVKLIMAAEAIRLLPLDLFQRILVVKPDGVEIDNLAFNGSTIELSGLAKSRGLLLDFLDELNDDKTFSSVDSPVSNLIKESNVDFAIKLHLANSYGQ